MTKPISDMTPYELFQMIGIKSSEDLTWEQANDILAKRLAKRIGLMMLINLATAFIIWWLDRDKHGGTDAA